MEGAILKSVCQALWRALAVNRDTTSTKYDVRLTPQGKASVRVRVRVCVTARVRLRARVCVCVRACVCARRVNFR